MSKLKKIFWTLVILALIFILVKNIFIPAYVSYVSVCKSQEFQKYEIAGKTTSEETVNETTGETEQNITIELYSKDPRVLKHELIHYNQIENERFYSCNYLGGLGKYTNELEAYTFQYLPNRAFERIYPKYNS